MVNKGGSCPGHGRVAALTIEELAGGLGGLGIASLPGRAVGHRPRGKPAGIDHGDGTPR